MTYPEYVFSVPQQLTAVQSKRLRQLAESFGGKINRSGTTYTFTGARGRKFDLLWRAGFSLAGKWRRDNGPQYVYRGPLDATTLELPHAVRLAQAMLTSTPATP